MPKVEIELKHLRELVNAAEAYADQYEADGEEIAAPLAEALNAATTLIADSRYL